MGAEHRIDALKPTPRQKTGGGGTADSSDASAAAPPVKVPVKRRGPRKKDTNRDSRDAGAPNKSVRSDTPAGTNPASKTAPKWGQTYD
jgi:hypothetical protein